MSKIVIKIASWAASLTI